ncbi:MAG: hypothetical protein EXS10_06965 [Phycisphaerales bacterium]|nr:hypothetical protein [Phycisphaerales bacterium]
MFDLISAAFACSTFAFACHAHGATEGYLAQPAMYGNTIVFVSEGDLWRAELGEDAAAPLRAARLTRGAGAESSPVFSPDGTMVAFAGVYGGNIDVYIIDLEGGAPTRLTHHPEADVPQCFTADGRIAFKSARSNPVRDTELWFVPIDGGLQVPAGFGECSLTSCSADGSLLAFNRWSNERWYWRGYRGGTAPDVWIGKFDGSASRRLTDDPSSDLFPNFILDRVAFLSDRDGTTNVWSDRVEGGDVQQITRFVDDSADPTALEGYQVRWLRADAKPRGSQLVFAQGGRLGLVDIQSGAVTRLSISLLSDRAATLAYTTDLLSNITEFTLSPLGSAIGLEARGDLFVGVPAKQASSAPLELWKVDSEGGREWGMTLADGSLFAITDDGGEQCLAAARLGGGQKLTRIESTCGEWMLAPVTTIQGDFAAYSDRSLALHLVDVKAQTQKIIDRSEAGEFVDLRFSPDGNWLAYAKQVRFDKAQIYLYEVSNGTRLLVSDGMSNDRMPRWDPKGLYLYFVSSRSVDPIMSEIDADHAFIATDIVMCVPLSAANPPPIAELTSACGFDLEAWSSPETLTIMDEIAYWDETQQMPITEGEDVTQQMPITEGEDVTQQMPITEGEDVTAPGSTASGDPRPSIIVEAEGIATRAFELPIPAAKFVGLEAGVGGVWGNRAPILGLNAEVWPSPAVGVPDKELVWYPLPPDSLVQVADEVAIFTVSADGRAMAWFDGTTLSYARDAATAAEDSEAIDLSNATIEVQPLREWAQMFDEAWRLQRDFFWAANMVGVDWNAMKTRYAALLPLVGTRAELDDVVGQMIGELRTSHAYVMPGEDLDPAPLAETGTLACDYETIDGAVFISHVVLGVGGVDALESPLAFAHLGRIEGCILKSIDGAEVHAGVDPNALLIGKVDKLVSLRLIDPQTSEERGIRVRPVASEAALRQRAWVTANRTAVAEASQGKLGYIYLPDMDGPGLEAFAREFYPQYSMDGMVIDARSNGGGFVSPQILSVLARKVLAYQKPRNGAAISYPEKVLDGPLAMLIDHASGSDGDIFPNAFRVMQLGKLIGTRTWGGVTGIRADKPAMDGSITTQPEYGWFEPPLGWTLENAGVTPDIIVEVTPEDRLAKRDPQLDRAVQELLDSLEKNPHKTPATPPWPTQKK